MDESVKISLASLVFWILEAVWKFFQYQYNPRIEALERAFREESFASVAPLQVYASWHAAFRAPRVGLLRIMFIGPVMFPHVVTLVAGIGLFVAHSAGIISTVK